MVCSYHRNQSHLGTLCPGQGQRLRSSDWTRRLHSQHVTLVSASSWTRPRPLFCGWRGSYIAGIWWSECTTRTRAADSPNSTCQTKGKKCSSKKWTVKDFCVWLPPLVRCQIWYRLVRKSCRPVICFNLFVSYCKFCIYAYLVNSKFTIWQIMCWIYWVGVNTKSTIWQLVVILQNLFLHPLSKFKIYNMKLVP